MFGDKKVTKKHRVYDKIRLRRLQNEFTHISRVETVHGAEKLT